MHHTTETNPTTTYDATLKKLTVRGATEFPTEVFDYANELEILDMSDNQLTALPDKLAVLRHLRIAFFSGSTFDEVPRALAACERLEMVGLKSCGIRTMSDHALPPMLRGLILTGNNLAELPDSIGAYTALQKLMLTGNQLTRLPQSLLQLKKLELLRISGNHLAQSPSWLAKLPNLAWYTDSENDCSQTAQSRPTAITKFDWQDIKLGPKLSENAKNVVYSATVKNGEQVAVKLFGQGITTDGSPDNDIMASIRAGAHPHIIGGLGVVANAPEDRQGLVMPLVPVAYHALGLPPDFVTLTRDVYPKNTIFPLSVVVSIAYGISSALQQLHARGIMHGDVYAHNILSTAAGDSKLGDMGAASLYDPRAPAEQWRQQLDVAGYGHVLEELLQHTSPATQDAGAMDDLQHLVEACLDHDASSRPRFADIAQALHAVQS